jgi:hypothetical protein
METTTQNNNQMTRPLILMGMVLLTVIALGVGYLALSAESKSSKERGKALAECVMENIDRGNATQYCRERV